MAATKLDIFNRALVKLGHRTLTTAADAIRTAENLESIYDSMRDRLLRAYVWKFAITRRSIAADGAAPVYGYDHRYAIPANVLRVFEVAGEWIALDVTDRRLFTDRAHKVEGGYVLTDTDTPLTLRGIEQITSEAAFDPLFTEVFICDLATEISQPLFVDEAIRERIKDDRSVALNQAIFGDSIEFPPKETPEETGYKWLGLHLPPNWRGIPGGN